MCNRTLQLYTNHVWHFTVLMHEYDTRVRREPYEVYSECRLRAIYTNASCIKKRARALLMFARFADSPLLDIHQV